MSKYYLTSDDLLASIKRRCMVPTSQATFQEQDFLDFATEEMNLGVVPMVIENHEDYYLYTETVPLEVNKNKYDIPYRAIGNKLKNVALIDQSGNLIEMTRISVADLVETSNRSITVNMGLSRFYMANNQICLPTDANLIDTNYSLQISYYLRPNALVPNDEVSRVIAVDRINGIITVDAIPEGFLVANLDGSSPAIDFIKAKSPHKILFYDINVSSFDQNTAIITLSPEDIPDELEMNDVIALACETCIPQIPSDMHVLLAHRVATRILESIGDTEGLQNANQKLAEMEKKSNILVTNRVDDAPKIINNRHSPLRSGLSRRRRWY